MALNANLNFSIECGGLHPKGEGGQKPGYIASLDEWEFSIENKEKLGMHASGGGSGYATFQDFTFKKLIDSSTHDLIAAMTKSVHFNGVELLLYKPPSSVSASTSMPMLFMRWTFDTFILNNIKNSMDDKGPAETLAAKFAGLKIEYWKQETKTGMLVPAGEYYWNSVKNSPSIAGNA